MHAWVLAGTVYRELVTIYDGNLNCDVPRNEIIVHTKQRERIYNLKQSPWINQQRPRSANNVNIDIFTYLGRRELEER